MVQHPGSWNNPKIFFFGDVLHFGWDLLWAFPHHFSWHDDIADLAPKSYFCQKIKLSSNLLLSILFTFFPHESLFFRIFSVKSCFRCSLLAFLPAKTSLLIRDAFASCFWVDFAVSHESCFPFRFSVNDPVALNCLITQHTVLWLTPTVLAISLDDLWQCWWRVTILACFFAVVSAIYFCLSGTKLTTKEQLQADCLA